MLYRGSAFKRIAPIMQTLTTKIAPLGNIFFGLGVMGSGIQQLITGKFVRLVPALPFWIPAHAVWPYLVGVALIISGLILAVSVKARVAAGVIGVALLLNFIIGHIPAILAAASHGYAWTNPLKVLALIGGTLLLISGGGGASSQHPGRGSGKENLSRVGRTLFAAFLIVGGVQHFVYADFVDTLIPTWITGARFWTYFAGSALIAGGTGLFIPRVARWAALLTGLMIFLWVILLHIPRAIADRTNAGETSAIFEALALSGVALIAAASIRPVPEHDAQPARVVSGK